MSKFKVKLIKKDHYEVNLSGQKFLLEKSELREFIQVLDNAIL